MFKKAIDQYIHEQDTIQVFQIWHNLCSELTSMICELLKCILAIQKTINELTTSNTKSDRPQVNIWDT